MKSYRFLAASSALLGLMVPESPAIAQGSTSVRTGPAFGTWGVDLSARDTSVRPGDSFFDYANGAWLKKAVIAPDRPVAGVSLDVVDLTQAQLRSVIESSVQNATSEPAQKIGKLYTSFMDEARIETVGDAPLQRDLTTLKLVKTKPEMVRYMGQAGEGFQSSLFGVQVIPAIKGPKLYTLAMGPGGMGLPNRDYYLEARFKTQRDAYAAHIARVLKLANWPAADAAAAAIMALETRIAEASWTMVELRDPNKIRYMTLAELKAHAPDFDWDTFFAAAKVPKFEQLVVVQDTAITKIARIFSETPIETMQAWQALRMTAAASAFLPKRFVDNNFLMARTLSGTQQLLPRWKRGVSFLEGSLGEALGQEYVRRHFPASSKKAIEDMVANLRVAMRLRLEQTSWMTPETRAAALDKLAKQRVKVGYPVKWRDYTALKASSTDLYGNIVRLSAFTNDYELAKLGKPVDREEWSMTPQTVNAYFNPLGNEIVFPAGMLQAPYFDPKADAAANYGAIGAVIGHEITHGFDDQGRQFDEEGNLRDWWKPADSERFNREAARLAIQYDAYEGIPGAKVNGKLTLGENIGDQGGLAIALDAYHASLKGKAAPTIGGLTGDQRFFLSYAQMRRGKMRDEMMKMMLVNDVHSPGRWRVDGTLRNIDAWYVAFGVKPGDKFYTKPEDRVRVW